MKQLALGFPFPDAGAVIGVEKLIPVKLSESDWWLHISVECQSQFKEQWQQRNCEAAGAGSPFS